MPSFDQQLLERIHTSQNIIKTGNPVKRNLFGRLRPQSLNSLLQQDEKLLEQLESACDALLQRTRVKQETRTP